MTDEFDERVEQIQKALLPILAGEHGAVVPLSPAHDNLDAVAYGINVLVQELQFEVAEQRRLRQELSRVLATMTDGLVVADLSGTLLRVNPALCRLVGRAEAELLGAPMTALSGDEATAAALRERVAAEERVDAFEWTLENSDGSTLPVMVNASMLPGLDGPNGLVCVIHDLRDLRTRLEAEADARAEKRRADELAAAHGELKDALAKLRATQTQLIQAQKMEALGHLAGGLAHDFNNMLVVILAAAEQVTLLSTGDPELRDEARQISEAAMRSQRLTGQLLTFARRQPHSPSVVSLNAVVGSGHEMLTRLLGGGVRYRTVLSATPWSVRVDPGQLEQVIVNLAVNARDAMPDGGELTVRTENRSFVSGAPEGLDPGEYACLEVEDSGVGMAADVMARMYDPFFTTKEAGKGTGLGLAICYGIVHGAGGRITVRSELGKGTCFSLYFPRVDQPRRAPSDEPIPEARGATVLLAEDEPGVRRVLVRTLEGAGYRVLSAEDGLSALELLGEHDGDVDLLLTDIRMPRMGGLELAARLRGERPALHVLFISGHTDQTLPPMPAGGGVAFLPKPFLPRQVLASVEALLARGGARVS